ncbi:MAG: carbohydrate ABC transporter permease [Phycisphaerae bacterium]|nr:carbohydrate ABC transporter permease [Phycisphaerae bacterium]
MSLEEPKLVARRPRREGVLNRIAFGSTYAFLTIVVLGMLFPFYWMVTTSLKSSENVFVDPPQWVPRQQFATIDGKQSPVSILRYRVRRTDDGAEMEIETRQLSGRAGRRVARIERDGRAFRVPVEIVSVLVREQREIDLTEGEQEALSTHWVESAAVSYPVHLKWDNYGKAWHAVPFARAYVNSLIVSVSQVLGVLITSSLAAFAFARLEWPGRDKVFFAYLATLMIPGAVTMIPVFILVTKMPALLDGLLGTHFFGANFYSLGGTYLGRPMGLDSYFALAVPGMFTAYGTFMLRQFFRTIARDYEEAARIDGCSTFAVYWRIVLPLSIPALATLGVFTFLGSWRGYIWPLIITFDDQMKTIPVLLRSFQSEYGTLYTLLMAGSVLDVIPLLIVFLIGQKFFMRGIQIGGVKG